MLEGNGKPGKAVGGYRKLWEAKESCGRQWEVMGSYVRRLWEAVGGYRKPSDVIEKLSEVIREAMGGCGRL